MNQVEMEIGDIRSFHMVMRLTNLEDILCQRPILNSLRASRWLLTSIKNFAQLHWKLLANPNFQQDFLAFDTIYVIKVQDL